MPAPEKKSYADKLKDPRWQKKRLEVLNRDNFTCLHCGDGTKTLHVHHTYYQYGKEPWDIPTESLLTLCSDCHETEEYYKQELTGTIRTLLADGYSSELINILLSGLLVPQKEMAMQRRVFIGMAAVCTPKYYLMIEKAIEEGGYNFLKNYPKPESE